MLEHNNSFSVPSHFIALPWLPLVTDLFYFFFLIFLTFPFYYIHGIQHTVQHKTHINWLICFIIRQFLVCCWFLFDFNALLLLPDCQVFIWHYGRFFFSSFSCHFLSIGFWVSSIVVRSNVLSLCWFSMPSLVIDLMDEFSFSSSAVLALVRYMRIYEYMLVNL